MVGKGLSDEVLSEQRAKPSEGGEWVCLWEEIQTAGEGPEVGSLLCPRNGQEASLTGEEGQRVSTGRDIGEEIGSGSCRLCSHASLWVLARQ